MLICDSIKTKLSLLGIESITPDRMAYGSNIYNAVTNAIKKCDVFVCFVDTNSTNVIFELGCAYGMNKKLLLVGDNPDLPFDLKGISYIPYGVQSSYELVSYLEKLNITKTDKSSSFYGSADSFDIQHHIDNPELIEQLSYAEFEEIIINWLKNMGYEVETSKTSRDFGYDLKLHLGNGTYAIVEIKKRSKMSKVPLAVVQQLAGQLLIEDANIGVVISNVGFTNAAHSYVSQVPQRLLLLTLDDLIKMFRTGDRLYLS